MPAVGVTGWVQRRTPELLALVTALYLVIWLGAPWFWHRDELGLPTYWLFAVSLAAVTVAAFWSRRARPGLVFPVAS